VLCSAPLRSNSLLALALLAAVSGCHSVLEPPVSAGIDKLMKPVQTAPNSVTLEIFHVRIPPEEANRVETLWDEIDEQWLSAETRRRLVANGFRSGVVGGALPDALADFIGIDPSQAGAPAADRVITDQAAAPKIRRRVVQLDRHEQTTIQASDLREEIRVLFGGEGQLRGKSFQQAQAVYALRAEAIDGQRVALRVAPEVHHGQLRNRYRGSDQGIFMMTPSRETETFEELRLDAELSPGELLVLGCLRDAGASLGHAFHRSPEASGAGDEKLVLVRLLQVPQSEILAR
jgi:hypothetical protein